MANEGIEVEIYGPANYNTKLGNFAGATEPEGLEQIKAIGGGSFKISKKDPTYIANPTWIKSRNLVKLRTDGTVSHAFLIDGKESIIVGSGEAAEQGYMVKGPGLKAFFDDADVYPDGGLKTLSGKSRYFNFASVTEGVWYVPANWTNPVNQGQVHASGSPWGAAPEKWPDAALSAQWIWVAAYVNPAGFTPCYFRHTVNITTAGTHAIYTAADDYFELYVDGQKLASSDPKTSALYTASRVEIELTTGNHVIAYMAKNTATWGGPAALAMALMRVAADKTETLVSRSGAGTWKCQAYPSTPPGWNIGEIITTLLNEAQTRGVIFPTLFTKTFTTSLDSNGTAWTDKLEWSFSVGESYASVFKKLEEFVDIWINPSTMQLNVAKVRGKDRTVAGHNGAFTQPISFLLGKHVREARTESRGKIKNVMTALTDEGWIEVVDSSLATSPFGRLESSIVTDNDVTFTRGIVANLFTQKSVEEEGASYDLFTDIYVPGVIFFVGDWVLAPNALGLQVPRRVMSISTKENDNGRPGYTIEFDTIFQSNEEVISNILQKNGSGGIGSGSSNVSSPGPSVGDPILLPPGSAPQPLIPQAPTGLAVSSAGAWDINGVNPISTATISWNPVTQNTDGSATAIAYYEVQARLTSAPSTAWTSLGTSTTTSMVIPGYTVGENWTYQVRAVSTTGGTSSFSSTASHTMLGPATPMAAPSIPTLSSTYGNLTVVWDGLLAGSTQPPVQFRYVYAEVSTAATGQPWVRKGSALSRGGGQITIPGETVGQNRYVRLTAIDGMGIASAASPVAGPQLITGVALGDLDASVGAAIAAAKEAGLDAQEQPNILQDPSFELNTTEFWLPITNTTNDTTQFHTGTRSMKVTTSAGSQFDSVHYQRIIAVEPGDRYYFRLWLRPSTTATVANFKLSVEYGATTAITSSADIGDGTDSAVNTWNEVTTEWTIPAGVYYMRPRIVIRDTVAGVTYWYDDFRILKMTGSTEIVAGAITTDHISSGSITATKMAADSIAAASIQAGAVTAGKIAANAITANEIAASAITADKIAAGSIQTSHIAADVGGQLDISANSSINIVAGQIAAVDANADATQSNLELMQTYYTFGAAGAVISKPGSVFALGLRNDKIEMLENGNTVSYWNSGQMYVTQLIAQKLNMGSHQVEAYGATGTIVRAL